MAETHIDLAYLERFCKGDKTRMEKYIKLYVDGAPALFDVLRSRSEAGDGEGLAVAAHTLRAQVNLMGAAHLFALLTTIEEQARAEGSAACEAHVSEALAASAQVMAELQAALAGS